MDDFIPPLWALETPSCPFCGCRNFRLISKVDVYDTLETNEETGEQQITLAQSSDVLEGADPLNCDLIECNECGEQMSPEMTEQIMQHMEKTKPRQEWG